MATIKTSELTGKALDYAVFLCLDDTLRQPELGMIRSQFGYGNFKPSANWAQGGPIVERMFLDGLRLHSAEFMTGIHNKDIIVASLNGDVKPGFYFGPTPLIAAMRCFVASNIGDNVEIPDELLKA